MEHPRRPDDAVTSSEASSLSVTYVATHDSGSGGRIRAYCRSATSRRADALDAARSIEHFRRDLDLDGFRAEDLVRAAVERKSGIVGEA